jgi:hypothetical protein
MERQVHPLGNQFTDLANDALRCTALCAGNESIKQKQTKNAAGRQKEKPHSGTLSITTERL